MNSFLFFRISSLILLAHGPAHDVGLAREIPRYQVAGGGRSSFTLLRCDDPFVSLRIGSSFGLEVFDFLYTLLAANEIAGSSPWTRTITGYSSPSDR